MRKFYFSILGASIGLGLYAALVSAATPFLVAAVIAVPLYLYGNKMACDRGLDSTDAEVPGTDPFVRLKNFGMAGLPVLAVMIAIGLTVQ